MPELPVYRTTAGKQQCIGTIPYATEEELTEFANKIRQAGGADLIPALMPSVPSQSNACLIANALNFGCMVEGTCLSDKFLDEDWWPDESLRESYWAMIFPSNMSEEEIRKIAAAVGCKPYFGHDIEPQIILPRKIGNTAQAFDDTDHDGWVAKYRQED